MIKNHYDVLFLLGHDQINYWLIRGAFNKFPDFFVQAFKIVIDS